MSSSWQEQFDVTCAEIKRIYSEAIEPVEKKFQYELFKPSWFADSLKPSKPFILFLGPFSAGKSTFINYLLGHDYLWTGPQPTTDKWTVILHGPESNTVSGRILTSNADLPFRGLAEFGNQFLETFSGMQVPSELLRNVTLIDTPGVLESAKEVHTRTYDYIKVARWFVEHSDLVFIMFDPSKLDAGVELRSLFGQFKGHESKLRIVLNKADQCEPQELMRVYGSLFWSLSNLIHTTEPPRVYVSSFWNKPYRTPCNKELFDEEKADLMYDLLEVVPLQCLDKRVTAVMRRALDVQIHAHIVATMKEKIPSMFGKSDAKKKMLANMAPIYAEVASKYKLTAADFPPPAQYSTFFDKPQVHMSEMPKLSDLEKEAKKSGENILRRLERVIRFDLPKLLHPLAQAAAVDPRKARKERQGQSNAPPDKFVYVEKVEENNTRAKPPQRAEQSAPAPSQPPQPPPQAAPVQPPPMPLPAYGAPPPASLSAPYGQPGPGFTQPYPNPQQQSYPGAPPGMPPSYPPQTPPYGGQHYGQPALPYNVPPPSPAPYPPQSQPYMPGYPPPQAAPSMAYNSQGMPAMQYNAPPPGSQPMSPVPPSVGYAAPPGAGSAPSPYATQGYTPQGQAPPMAYPPPSPTAGQAPSTPQGYPAASTPYFQGYASASPAPFSAPQATGMPPQYAASPQSQSQGYAPPAQSSPVTSQGYPTPSQPAAPNCPVAPQSHSQGYGAPPVTAMPVVQDQQLPSAHSPVPENATTSGVQSQPQGCAVPPQSPTPNASSSTISTAQPSSQTEGTQALTPEHSDTSAAAVQPESPTSEHVDQAPSPVPENPHDNQSSATASPRTDTSEGQ